MVGDAFVSVLIPLCLALKAVKDRSDHLLARGVAGGDIKELLSGSQALMSQLMDQELVGGPRWESPYDIGVGEERIKMPKRRGELG